MNQGVCQTVLLTVLLAGIGASIGFSQWNHFIEMDLWNKVVKDVELNREKITNVQIQIATLTERIGTNGYFGNP